jgi:hypothetical protein
LILLRRRAPISCQRPNAALIDANELTEEIVAQTSHIPNELLLRVDLLEKVDKLGHRIQRAFEQIPIVEVLNDFEDGLGIRHEFGQYIDMITICSNCP